MQWIISHLRENPILINDMGHIHDLLKSYEYYKLRLPEEQQDIYKLNYQQVFDIIDKIDNPEVDFENTKETDLNINGVNQDEYGVIYDGPLGRLVVLKTKNASCGFGRGTKWCIAATIYFNSFETYTIDGPMYVWITKDGKYAFQLESIVFTDKYNEQIDWDIIKNWRNNHPVLSKLFRKCEKTFGNDYQTLKIRNLVNYGIYVLDKERLSKHAEKLIFTQGNKADVIKYNKHHNPI